MSKWRVWHSAKSFAEFIVDNTILSTFKKDLEYKPLPESDASKAASFHQVPDHIKKILYLDAADVIIEREQEPILCIEETKEAGTGHNAFQRFARIAAAVENNVPAIYIQPEAVIIERQDTPPRWDAINPMVFKAYKEVMDIFKIPALFFYYPSDYATFKKQPETSPNFATKGIKFNKDIVKYPGCPTAKDPEMASLFEVINNVIKHFDKGCPVENLIDERVIRNRKDWMLSQYHAKLNGRQPEEMSPISATKKIQTSKLLEYLTRFSKTNANDVSELLASRPETIIYRCNAGFRGDPYAGTLCAIDYLMTRLGKTFENRDKNLVLCFGDVEESDSTIEVVSKKCSVDDFIKTVSNCDSKNLLTTKKFSKLRPQDISRYYMQVRYGSTYSKVKHIRVFSYFADAIIFKDGAVWRAA